MMLGWCSKLLGVLDGHLLLQLKWLLVVVTSHRFRWLLWWLGHCTVSSQCRCIFLFVCRSVKGVCGVPSVFDDNFFYEDSSERNENVLSGWCQQEVPVATEILRWLLLDLSFIPPHHIILRDRPKTNWRKLVRDDTLMDVGSKREQTTTLWLCVFHHCRQWLPFCSRTLMQLMIWHVQ